MKCDDFALRSVSLDEAWRQDESEMEIHYGSEFPQWHQELARRLTTRKSGVTLLRGDPGTGKTTFLRHLIVSLNETHRFLYLPLNNGWMLAGFQSVEFWHKQRLLDPDRKLVIIIEDAEEFLMERTNARDGNHVSDLLNIGDGLMGDYLQLHLICTINCPLNVLDKAVPALAGCWPIGNSTVITRTRATGGSSKGLGHSRTGKLFAGGDL